MQTKRKALQTFKSSPQRTPTCLCWLLQLLLAVHNLRHNSEASNLQVPHLPQKGSVTLSFLLTPLTPRLDRVGGEGGVTNVESFT